MSGSYRGYFIAAGITAFAFVGLTGSAELRCQRDYYAEYAYYIHNDTEHSQPTRFDRGWLPCLIERSTANPDAQQANEKEQRDLVAQESMALWAFWMAAFAGITALVTSLGTILIWKQVSLTREAVQDTNEATKAMGEANKIAEDAAHRQLRAYIAPGEASVSVSRKDGMTYLEIRTPLRNVGQTPAYLKKYRNFEKFGDSGRSGQFTMHSDIIISPNSEFCSMGSSGTRFDPDDGRSLQCWAAVLFSYADYLGREYTEIIIWISEDIPVNTAEGVFELRLLSQVPGPQGEWQWDPINE